MRVQDARYQQTIVNYQDTVLNACRQVEDAMAAFVQSREESKFREAGTTSAKRSSVLPATLKLYLSLPDHYHDWPFLTKPQGGTS